MLKTLVFCFLVREASVKLYIYINIIIKHLYSGRQYYRHSLHFDYFLIQEQGSADNQIINTKRIKKKKAYTSSTQTYIHLKLALTPHI